jgi:nitrogen fixation protein|tara:strand:+ start:288 stop:869 length:582 start_codon:yes stop_codon:yes gene_type:complete
MINNFKAPNLNAPRYREKRIGFLNLKHFNEFKEKYPLYANIDNKKLKSIIGLYNEKLWNGVIDNRDGVELPDSLGYLFIGTCPPAKGVNTDYSLSRQYGKVLQNKNWETDGNIGKIFYTNYSTKYRFKNRELWKFTATRKFKRAVAKIYPEKWTKYIVMKNKVRVTDLYKSKAIVNKELEESKALKNYNEFEI